jgi:nucleotide-binding universal stress UspA family protein
MARMTIMMAPAERTIVVGTDGSKTAERAVREAAGLARATGARLVLVSAFSDLHPFRERMVSSARESLIDLEKVSEQVLQRALGLIDDGFEVETVSRKGDPAEVLADLAQERGAHTIVVGDRGLTGVKRFLLGSVSNKLAHHAPCDTLVVRGSADD